MKYLKKLLICIYSFLGLFSVAVLIQFAITGNEPTVLVGSVFTVAGVESMLGALIKTTEVNKNGNSDGKC